MLTIKPSPLTPLTLLALLALLAGCASKPSNATASSPSGEPPTGEPPAQPLTEQQIEATRVKVGSTAPSFTLPMVQDPKQKVTAPRQGKVTVILFWATWSQPDVKELAKLQGIRSRYPESDVDIVGVSIDDEPKQVPDVVTSYGAKYPVVWDEKHRIAETYKPRSDPSTYIIDRRGKVRFEHGGYHDGEDREMDDEVRTLVREPK